MSRYDPAVRGEILSVRFWSEAGVRRDRSCEKARRSSSREGMERPVYREGSRIGIGAIVFSEQSIFEPKLSSDSLGDQRDSSGCKDSFEVNRLYVQNCQKPKHSGVFKTLQYINLRKSSTNFGEIENG